MVADSGGAMDSKYIYGIINSHTAPANISGLDSRPIYAIAHQGLSCLVSDYFGLEFGSMPKKEVVRHLLGHQLVVEQAMRQHPVLPVKFGTILATAEEVSHLLEQGHPQFLEALARIEDKVEMEVAATWDMQRVLQEVSQEEAIARTRQALASRPEPPTMEERLHLGKMVKACLDRRRESYQEALLSFLQPVAVDGQPNALVCDEMVMNVAFLVERARLEAFDSQVRQLDDRFQGRINLRIIGPLPPYSFASVEVARLDPHKLEQARQLLGLGKVIAEPQVRWAYRHLAAETHPDSQPVRFVRPADSVSSFGADSDTLFGGDELAQTRFVQLRQAADLLIDYCRAYTHGNWLIHIKRRNLEELPQLSLAVAGGAAHG